MGRFEGALKDSLILTRNHFSIQALAQRNQILALGGRGEVEWMLKWGFVPWLVSNEWGGRKGVFILNPETSRYCAKLGFLGTSDMGSELPRGLAETQQWRHIGSSDPRSVLPSPWLKLASEAISVLPTMAENWGREKQTCTSRLGFRLTHLGHLLKHF
jgi:hypothetical protein